MYIGSADGRIFALRADSGEVAWTLQTGDKVRATPLVVDGTVYVGSWDKSMYALEAETGALRWQTPIGGQIQTTAAVYGHLVISASRKASVVALDADSGEVAWEFVYGNNMWVESSPVIVGDTVYIGSSGNQVVYGLDAQTGKLRLMYNTRAFCWSRPLVIDRTLVIGCTNANNPKHGLYVYEIDPHPTYENLSVLTPVWQLPMGESRATSGFWAGVASSPVSAGEQVYFGGLDGMIYAVTP